MNTYDFKMQLDLSVKSDGKPFEQIIANSMPDVASVAKTNVAVDKTGVDYIATLNSGIQINIDLKLRTPGCSRFWKNGQEELALETWSVIPDSNNHGKIGWTLDRLKNTHYTLHVFSEKDSSNAFLLPFQLLRKAFKKHGPSWMVRFRNEVQSSGTWRSQCVFVPAFLVLDSISDASLIIIKDK